MRRKHRNPGRKCQQCGRAIGANYRFCMQCWIRRKHPERDRREVEL